MLRSFTPVLYVRISPERLVVTNVKNGTSVSDVPDVAISGSEPKRVLACGSAARRAAAQSGGTVVNPFAHPRSLISDFSVAEQLLKTFVRQVIGKSWFVPSPAIVIHPLGDPEGGFTQVESRAFRELARSAGASKAYLLKGAEVDPQEIADIFDSGRRPGE
ncbi:MAG TPA: rod shape-determining protein [Ramlibacter sp.]|uniref:rod shape-determining protein n=1 Tax=Ramlibacter sp. TaxID=1917967 RepID=UPI002CCD11F2|nr:rod shape-determining protein [Ramlibacter sp.]HVZ44181.1 rod shape-determining protein [Ramlibacter sp.]